MRTLNRDYRKLTIESVAFGLGYAAVLIWIGSALVASFTGGEANPYWPNIPYLRTDTSGVAAFAIASVTLSLSRHLQLRRRSTAPVPAPLEQSVRILAVQAVAETAMVLATGMVIYLSFNAFKHPETLRLQLTHLWPWPSEGTVRVIGLVICFVGAATSRFVRGRATIPSQTVQVTEAAAAAEAVSVLGQTKEA